VKGKPRKGKEGGLEGKKCRNIDLLKKDLPGPSKDEEKGTRRAKEKRKKSTSTKKKSKQFDLKKTSTPLREARKNHV